MNANKVYESIIKLLFNVVRNDELKYHLYKNKKYLAKFVDLINALLKLEIDDDATYNDQQWAKTFGKAIVIISQIKQRIEKSEKNIDQIYETYSQFISFTNSEYQIKNLDKTSINFTQQDVLDDAKLTQDKITYFDERENEKELRAKEEQDRQNQEKTTLKKDEKNQESGASFLNTSKNNNQLNNFNNPFANNNLANLPLPPTADPRFYPYNKKQKGFPTVKIVLGIITIIFTLFMAIVPIFVMVKPIVFPEDVTLIAGWRILEQNQGQLGGATVIGNINGKVDLTGNPVGSLAGIFNIIVLLVFGGFISYSFLRKPRMIKEKYRISYWTIVPLVIIVSLNISLFYTFLDPNLIKNYWHRTLLAMVGQNEFKIDEFNEWWTFIQNSKNLEVLQGLAIGGLVFSFILITGIVGVILAQPRLDHEKINYANNEYQMAVSAAMQGQKYEMDPNLFENEDEVVINKKTKFKLWLEKISKKKKKK